MSELVPGFRFYPTEDELVSFYLYHKLRAQRHDIDLVIPVVDIYKHEPWDLPGESGVLCRGDTEQWFFFVPQQEREARGGRPTRITRSGYWKATGSPGYVYSSHNRVIGLKKSMVFYKGRSPNVQKTKWKMNEYRAIHEERAGAAAVAAATDVLVPKVRYEYSLCRVYNVSGNIRAFDRRPETAVVTRNVNAICDVPGETPGEPTPLSAATEEMDATWDWEQLINN